MNTTPVTDVELPASVAEFSSADLKDADLLPLPSPHRHKKMLTVILVVVLILLLLLMGYAIAAGNFTLYARTIKQIKFDYRQGEITDQPLEAVTKTTADVIMQQLGERDVAIEAVAMLFNENGTYTPTLTLYSYLHTAKETAADTLTMQTCAEYWFPTETTSLKQNADGQCYISTENEQNNWTETDSFHIPNLYDYCFATEETDGVEHYASYHSRVGNTNYLCEIWLMEEESEEDTVYNTLYRYYDGDRLCALRLLPSYSTNMLVFDIVDYRAE